MSKKTRKPKVKHLSANEIEIAFKLYLAALVPGLEVIRSGLYDAFSPDLKCLLSQFLGGNVEDASFECKSYKSFASSQIGLQYDRTSFDVEISKDYKHIKSAVNLVDKVKNMKDKVQQIMNMFPCGSVPLDGLSNIELIKCIQDLYASKGNKGFCLEGSDGSLMVLPIYSLSHYVTASARLRWHRCGSEAHFGGTPYIDDAFNKMFEDLNASYETYRVKQNKHNPTKKTDEYYNYLKTDAPLSNTFRHTTIDGRTYEFQRIGTTNEWQVRYIRPVEETTLCIEFKIKIVGTQRKSDLEDVKYLLNNGRFPVRKYIPIRDRTKHTYKLNK